MSQQDFQYQQIVEAFSVIGKACGQVFVLILRIGLVYVEGRITGRISSGANQEPTVERAVFDRKAAANYIGLGLTKFDELRQIEDLGEFKDAGRPKFPKQYLDAYIKRRRKGG